MDYYIKNKKGEQWENLKTKSIDFLHKSKLAVVGRGIAGELLEFFKKEGFVPKSAGNADILYGEGGFRQQLHCFFDADLGDIFRQGLPLQLMKHPA